MAGDGACLLRAEGDTACTVSAGAQRRKFDAGTPERGGHEVHALAGPHRPQREHGAGPSGLGSGDPREAQQQGPQHALHRPPPLMLPPHMAKLGIADGAGGGMHPHAAHMQHSQNHHAAQQGQQHGGHAPQQHHSGPLSASSGLGGSLGLAGSGLGPLSPGSSGGPPPHMVGGPGMGGLPSPGGMGGPPGQWVHQAFMGPGGQPHYLSMVPGAVLWNVPLLEHVCLLGVTKMAVESESLGCSEAVILCWIGEMVKSAHVHTIYATPAHCRSILTSCIASAVTLGLSVPSGPSPSGLPIPKHCQLPRSNGPYSDWH